jgi:hypothetical protein
MSHGILNTVGFAIKGSLVGFSLGIAGAVFGTIIGSSFASIWASGMPLGMAFLGGMIFTILSGIGMFDTLPGEPPQRQMHY